MAEAQRQGAQPKEGGEIGVNAGVGVEDRGGLCPGAAVPAAAGELDAGGGDLAAAAAGNVMVTWKVVPDGEVS